MTTTQQGYQVRRVEAAGRGVFAARRFGVGDFVCRDPVLLIDQADWSRCETTILGDYAYKWPEAGRPRALSLGIGSLFNASERPNVDVEIDIAGKALVFRAIRPIAAGEEMVLDYDWGAGAASRIEAGKSRLLHEVA
jgi:uncharacterized protein